ncbi:MAG TPA: hypothetical protein VJ735_15195 [Actinomycetes bacterium]|nr:hypothetical protein [Actinomycetes bacterium]
MSSAATPDDSHQVDEVLRHRTGELDPVADDLRAALLRGASPESLGLTDDGLATVLEERGIG